MLRRLCRVTKLDRIRNKRIKGTTKVGEISTNVQERRLTWYGHVMRREEHYVGRRAMELKVQGRRKASEKMVGQSEGSYQREETVEGGGIRPSLMAAYIVKH